MLLTQRNKRVIRARKKAAALRRAQFVQPPRKKLTRMNGHGYTKYNAVLREIIVDFKRQEQGEVPLNELPCMSDALLPAAVAAAEVDAANGVDGDSDAERVEVEEQLTDPAIIVTRNVAATLTPCTRGTATSLKKRFRAGWASRLCVATVDRMERTHARALPRGREH
jgi:hypothetical protein